MAPNTAKPAIFLAFASELAGVTLRLLPEEARRLRAALRPAEDARWCEVVVRQSVTLADILNVFQDPCYHGRIALFHYAGHADAYDLLLTDAQGDANTANAKGFAAFLAEQPGLDVVFLNACSTQGQVDDLLAAGVKAVIATGDEISDDWAVPFAERFYTGLAGGSGLAATFRAAEGALRAELGEQEWPWGLYPAPDGGALAAWRLKTVQVAPSTYLWVNVPPKPAAPLLGRDVLLTDLVTRLLTGHSPALTTDGLPGVGKTALAVALAHDEQVRAHFVDGVLWGGLGVNPDVVTIQNQWATALGFDLAEVPDVHERTRRLSTWVGERRLLVVLDDAWDVDAAAVLRLSSPNVVHLLTTRDRKIARDFAGAGQQVHVQELAEEPAFALLQRLAPEACKADARAAHALVKTVGELPLALEVLGGYLAGPVLRKAQVSALATMGDAKRRLALAAKRLGGQAGKKETLDAVIRLSVEALPEEAQAVFCALGAFAPKPATFDLVAAETVTAAAADLLDLLAQRNLVEVGHGETLAVHQVVHDVMAGEVPEAARVRYLDYYIHQLVTCTSSAMLLEVYERIRYVSDFSEAVPSGELGAMLDAIDVHQRSTGARTSLVPCILPAAKYAFTRGQRQSLAGWLKNRLQRADLSTNEMGWLNFALGATCGPLHELEDAQCAYMAAAQLLVTDEVEAHARIRLGLASIAAEQGNFDDAAGYLDEARTLAGKWLAQAPVHTHDAAVQLLADTYSASGQVASDTGDWPAASRWLSAALLLYFRRRKRFPGGYAKVLEIIGFAHWQHADRMAEEASTPRSRIFAEHRKALHAAERGLAVLQTGLLDVEGLALAWWNLGDYAEKCSEDPVLTPAEQASYANQAAEARAALDALCEQYGLANPADV